MGLDIKLPIGLMFTIFGILLTLFGIFTYSDAGLYSRSLGININLWSGAGMLVFGCIMLFLVYLSKGKKKSQEMKGK
jgi:hypothetical protein